MTKLAQYKKELADLMDTYNDPDTPKDIKDVMEQAIESVKKLIKEEEEKESKEPAKKAAAPKKETPAKAPVKRIAAKKPKEAKEAPAKKAAMTALEKCKDIIAKYREKKKADAERIEKRKKAGKPAELTPAETVSKAAKKVEAKVVEMERPLKVSEEAALISGVVKTVVSALEGIEKPERQKRFVQKIIENLQRLNKGIKLRAEDGMYLEDEELEMDDMGEAGDMGELAEALMGKVNEIHHHAKEIKEALRKGAEVEDWVLMKSTRASTDLSDIAHYLDNDVAEGDKMVFGGSFFNSAAPAKKWKADEFEEMNQALVDVYKNLYVIEDREIRKDIEDKVYEIQEMLETYGTDSLPYADGGGVEDGYMEKGGRLSVKKKYESISEYSKYAKKGDLVLIERSEKDLEWIGDNHLSRVQEVKDGEVIFKMVGKKGLFSYPSNYSVIVVNRKYESGGHMAKGGTTFGKFGSGRMNKNAWISANYIGDSKVTLGELQSYLERNTSEKFDKDKIYTITRTLFQTGDYTIDDKKEWKESIIYRKRKMASGGHMAKGGEVEIIETKFNSHKNHNPYTDIIEGKIDNDSFITYYVNVKGNEVGKEGMELYVGENYVEGSKKRSSSRNFSVDQIPLKYKKAWNKLKLEYQEKYKNKLSSGGHMAMGGRIGFTEIDYNRLIGDRENGYPYYSVKDGSIWTIRDEKTEKKVATWNPSKEELIILDNKLNDWLREHSYSSGGHMEKGGYNRSWHQDRAQYNKSERWEIPMNQRKSSYADGGTTNRATYPDLSKVKPNVID